MGRTQAVTILFCDLVASTERRPAWATTPSTSSRTVHGHAPGSDRRIRRPGRQQRGRRVDGRVPRQRRRRGGVRDHDASLGCRPRPTGPAAPADRDQLGRGRPGRRRFSGMPIVEAARLEAAAAAGQDAGQRGRALARRTRRAFRFRDVGELTLKGLPAPLATVEVIDDEVGEIPSHAAVPAPGPVPVPPAPATPGRSRWPLVAGVGVAVVAIGTSDRRYRRSRVAPGAAAAVTPPRRPGVAAREGVHAHRSEPTPCVPRTIVSQVPDGRLRRPRRPRGSHASRSTARSGSRSPEHRRGPGKGAWIRSSRSGGILGGKTVEDPAKSPARDHAELIEIPTRLTETSDPAMACPEFEPIGARAPGEAQQRDPATIAAGQQALRACHDRLAKSGVGLAHYSVEDAADDVLDLMRALNIRPAPTSSPAAIRRSVPTPSVRDAPGAVRTLTLDGPDAPGTSTFSDPTAQVSTAFDQYLAALPGEHQLRAGVSQPFRDRVAPTGSGSTANPVMRECAAIRREATTRLGRR